MELLPVGTRVLISPSSKFYGVGFDNPKDEEGVIVKHIISNLGSEFVYKVEWDNGMRNSYRVGDLIEVERTGFVGWIRKVEENAV